MSRICNCGRVCVKGNCPSCDYKKKAENSVKKCEVHNIILIDGECYYCKVEAKAKEKDFFNKIKNAKKSIEKNNNTGWVCPICKRGVSPFINYCRCVQ